VKLPAAPALALSRSGTANPLAADLGRTPFRLRRPLVCRRVLTAFGSHAGAHRGRDQNCDGPAPCRESTDLPADEAIKRPVSVTLEADWRDTGRIDAARSIPRRVHPDATPVFRMFRKFTRAPVAGDAGAAAADRPIGRILAPGMASHHEIADH